MCLHDNDDVEDINIFRLNLIAIYWENSHCEDAPYYIFRGKGYSREVLLWNARNME